MTRLNALDVSETIAANKRQVRRKKGARDRRLCLLTLIYARNLSV